MDLVSKQNGIITGYQNGRLLAGNVFYIEAKGQVYEDSRAEHCRTAYTVSVDKSALSMEPALICSGDLVQVDSAVQIDKKNLTVTVFGASIKVIKLSKIDKIVSGNGVGSISRFGQTLLLTVLEKVDKENKDYNQAKFRFKDTLGEGHVDVDGDIRLCAVDLETGTQRLLSFPDRVMPIKAGLARDGTVIFLAISRTLPRNSGVIYCSNKPIGLYMLAGEQVMAICDKYSYRSLLFSADHSQFVALQCPLGGAHLQPSSLVLCSMDAAYRPRVLCEGLVVGSVFGMDIPDQRWTGCIYLTLQDRFYSQVARIHVDGGSTEILSNRDESWSIVSVLSDGTVVAQHSSVLTPPILGVIGKQDLRMIKQAPPESIDGSIELIAVHKHCEALLVTPRQTAKPNEVILMPHGGPNSNYVNEYLPFLACLLGGGYALCRVNYTGSTGYGMASIDGLIKAGQVGVADVADCMLVHSELRKRSYSVIHVFGGSHGGYLSACLSSQHPASFAKCIMLNPVIAMYANCVSSDIFDYVYENLGLVYEHAPPTKEQLELFYERSPRPTKQNPPTLVVVGGCDLRVPPFNGLSWYGWLRALGVETECLFFKDCNHALSTPEADRDLQMAVLSFLK